MNDVKLHGRLGKESPELKHSAKGTAYVRFTFVTSRKIKGVEHKEWHRIVAYGKVAETISQYVKAGQELVLSGMISYGQYEKAGVKHYTTDIILDKFDFCGSKRDQQAEPVEPPDEDLPF